MAAEMDADSIVIRNPFDGCFLCDPEPWRVILDAKTVRLIAGLGPLCAGYVILAPKQHLYTAAELPEETFSEFLLAASQTVTALETQYAEGFTAYEHAKTGACYTLELRRDFSTFCHHCHRVFIPRATDSVARVAEWFPEWIDLPDPVAIRALRDRPYVFYETGRNGKSSVRRAYLGNEAIPSQFMRRILSDEMALGRSWDWSVDPHYDEMLDTVHRLRGAFAKQLATSADSHRAGQRMHGQGAST